MTSWKCTQAGCDEVALQDIQNHIPKQSNTFQKLNTFQVTWSNSMKLNEFQNPHSYQPNETS